LFACCDLWDRVSIEVDIDLKGKDGKGEIHTAAFLALSAAVGSTVGVVSAISISEDEWTWVILFYLE
jgi:ribonuclease PH